MGWKTETRLGWHIIDKDRTLAHGDDRKVKLGRTICVHTGTYRRRNIEICRYGLHASPTILEALKYRTSGVLTRVETSGKTHIDRKWHGLDKWAAEYRKVLAFFPKWERGSWKVFAKIILEAKYKWTKEEKAFLQYVIKTDHIKSKIKKAAKKYRIKHERWSKHNCFHVSNKMYMDILMRDIEYGDAVVIYEGHLYTKYKEALDEYFLKQMKTKEVMRVKRRKAR